MFGLRLNGTGRRTGADSRVFHVNHAADQVGHPVGTVGTDPMPHAGHSWEQRWHGLRSVRYPDASACELTPSENLTALE